MNDILEMLLRLQNLDLGVERATANAPTREDLRKKLPAQVLQHYDRLRALGKKGIAAVRRGVCAQCHMQVPVGLLAELHRRGDMHRCENCGCYLHLVEEAPVLEMPVRQTRPARRGRPPRVVAHAA